MKKNMRRALVIAAGVSGAWALGPAVAGAQPQPAHSVSVPDAPVPDAAVPDVSVPDVSVPEGAVPHVSEPGGPAGVAHTTAAPASASGLGDVLSEVTSPVLQAPPVADTLTGLAETAAALQKNLPDPAAPGSLPYTALKVAGDALYIGEGIEGDVNAGRVPDSVPQDTLRLVQDAVDGLGGQASGGPAPGGQLLGGR